MCIVNGTIYRLIILRTYQEREELVWDTGLQIHIHLEQISLLQEDENKDNWADHKQ